MAIRLAGGTYIRRAHPTPSYPFWQRVFARIDSSPAGVQLLICNCAADFALPRLTARVLSNANMDVANQTSWGTSPAVVPWTDINQYDDATLQPFLVQWVSAESARAYSPANTAGTLLTFTNPSASELSGIAFVNLATDNQPTHLAEFAEGTGTLTSQNITDLLSTATVESISGLTLTNNTPLHPAGTSGDAVAGPLTSLLGDNMTVGGTVTISSLAHPVTRSTDGGGGSASLPPISNSYRQRRA